jgi:hypothetical protein
MLAAIFGLVANIWKALSTMGVQTGFKDYWDTIANDATPSTTYWTTVESSAGTVDVLNDHAGLGWLLCNVPQGSGGTGLIHSRNKKVFSLKSDIESIHLKGRFKFNWGTEADDKSIGVGFMKNDSAPTTMADIETTANQIVSILVDSGTPRAWTSDGSNVEVTDLSLYIIKNTEFDLEIVITSEDVKFYINGSLRATHETNIPDSCWQVVMGITGSSGYLHSLYCQWISIYAE